MKKIFLLIGLVALFGLVATPTYAASFSEKFNKAHSNKWDFSYSPYGPGRSGNWRIENKMLIQDEGGDNFIALVKNIQNADQTIETQLNINPNSYGGVTVWFKDGANYVSVILYPGHGEIWVEENINNTMNLFRYAGVSGERTWFTLKVITTSTSGKLDIYLNNVYILTHNTITTYRIGNSGLMSGNGGGYFDNFSIVSPKTGKGH